MAATITLTKGGVPGDLRYRIVTVTGDASGYTNGTGYALTPATMDLTKVLFATPAFSVGGYVARYDTTNNKVTLYFGDNNNASDGPLIEIATTGSSLATEVFTFYVLGI